MIVAVGEAHHDTHELRDVADIPEKQLLNLTLGQLRNSQKFLLDLLRLVEKSDRADMELD